MRNLRYRYFVWLERLISKLDDEINETPRLLRAEFKPQEEYPPSDQFLFSAVACIFVPYVGLLRVKRAFDKLELGEKFTVRMTVKNSSVLENTSNKPEAKPE